MTCDELEKASVALVLKRIGALVDSNGLLITNQSGVSITTEFPTVGFTEAVSDGTEFGVLTTRNNVGFHIYRGESNNERKTPCVVLSSTSCDMDIDSGNDMCQLDVDVMVPADDHEGQADQIALADAANDAIGNIFRSDDLQDQLNQFAGPLFSAIGVASISGSRFNVERTNVHRTSLQILAANSNLVTA